jgi:mRNA interferase MazF
MSFARGDVHVLKAPRSTRGHEQRGKRYAVIVQDDTLTLSTVLIAPTSTRVIPLIYRPQVSILDQTTCVLPEQVTAADPFRLGEWVGHLTRAEMDHVDFALRVVLGLS